MWLAAERSISAPADRVWDILVDLGRWGVWGPSLRSATTVDDAPLGLGVRGTVTTVAGPSLPFVVTEFDPGHVWAWRVAGLPATRHVVDAGPCGTRVRIEVPWWAAPYVAVCEIAVRRIERLAVTPPARPQPRRRSLD